MRPLLGAGVLGLRGFTEGEGCARIQPDVRRPHVVAHTLLDGRDRYFLQLLTTFQPVLGAGIGSGEQRFPFEFDPAQADISQPSGSKGAVAEVRLPPDLGRWEEAGIGFGPTMDQTEPRITGGQLQTLIMKRS